MDVELDRARYRSDREKDVRLSGEEGIDAAMKQQALDALLFPAWSGAARAARPGYPTVIVPFGLVPNEPAPGASPPPAPFPAGFEPKLSPYGVSFTGLACSEPRLLELAYAFEQATRRRVPPASAP
jgi:amidase